MGAGGRARLLAACLPTVLMAGAGTVSGVLVSTQVQQQGEQQQVLGVHEVGKSRHGGGGGGGGVNNNSRLRGAGSTNPSFGFAGPPPATTTTTAFSDLPRPEEAGEEARMKGAGGNNESGGRGWGGEGKRGSQKAGVSAGAGPREEGVATGAREQEAKQGSRRSDQQQDDNVNVSDHDSSGQSITVIAACIGAVVAFSVVWCWLSSMVVCVSWCVCKCVRPNSRRDSSSSPSSTENKHVDTYAGAVRATFCGTLASVVCVSDGGSAEKNDNGGQEEAFPASHPCTRQPGSSIGSTSSEDNLSDASTAVTHGEVTATLPADAPPATAINGTAPANNDCCGAVSNYSAFSAIFRRALTATALPPDTPTAHGSPSVVCDGAQHRQQQHRLDGSSGDGGSDGNPLAVRPIGGGGGGDIALVWGEEKQSENGDRTTADAARPRGRSFLRSSGGASGGTPWMHRFWARFSGDNCRHEASRRWGTGGGAASGAWNGSPERSSAENGSPEGSLGENGSPEGSLGEVAFEGHHGLVDALSHRRRVARWARLAGRSRAGERGRGTSDGHLGAAAAAAATATAVEPGSSGDNSSSSRSRGNAAAGCVVGTTTTAATDQQQVPAEPAVSATPALPEPAAEGTPRSSSSTATTTNDNDEGGGGGGGGGEAAAAGGGAAAEVSREGGGFLPRGGGVVAEDAAGNGDGERGGERDESRAPGDAESISPAGLPRARMLWRAFSEVDHSKIEDNHRRAALRHLARFGPAPGVRNPPMCYGPI